ncbi:MAG: dUTP diphosphatase [Ilumatobacteraceae bacterium]
MSDANGPLAGPEFLSGRERTSVPIVRLDGGLALPAYAHEGDAGVDLVSAVDVVVPAAGGRVLVPTGIAIALPRGFAGLVLPRSGLALKHGITVANAPGLIDCAYRGEIKVIVLNTDPAADYAIRRGDRIAQLVVQRVAEVTWSEVESLEGDDRGGGFGHSGR